MKLFDAHCHLQFPQYAADLPEVLARMRALEMGALVIGTDYETSKAGLELAAQHDFLWAAVGLHPNDNLDEHFAISKYEQLAQDPKVVAIGECGLDYFRSGKTEAERRRQKERFGAQIALALTLRKPLIIHCRDPLQPAEGEARAHDDCIELLRQTRAVSQVPVVIHFFTGTGELAQRYLDLGCYLSFPGPVTYTDMYDESIRVCPLERMLVETDAPFAAPVPHRGARNEPAYVLEVARKVAAVKGLPLDEIAQRTAATGKAVFRV